MTIDIHINPDFLVQELEKDVREGFSSTPKELPPKWFYDDRGSQLFEEIMCLEEYYQTRCERQILTAHADEIAQITRVDTLVELGSGNSEKTLLLLEAMSKTDHCDRFVPFDVSESALRRSVQAAIDGFPNIQVHGVVGDFNHHLDLIPHEGKRLIVFLGGTIGNFPPAERKVFLNDISEMMDPGDFFLIGTDLIKDKEKLIRAYNDQKGITAAFNLNVLNVLNRELNANFNLENFEHKAIYDEEMEWIEIRIKSMLSQEVQIKNLEMTVKFEKGEEILTEISAKFSPKGICEEVEAAGLSVAEQWTDEAGNYLLTLARAN